MAEELVTLERAQAAKDYLAALKGLGFPVEALLWTLPENSEERDRTAAGLPDAFELAVVSRVIELTGPRDIYHLLLTAYEHAGTPKTINPWCVHLYGASTDFAEALKNMHIVGAARPYYSTGEAGPLIQPWHFASGRIFVPSWIYQRNFKSVDMTRDLRAIERFKQNVAALAA